MAYGNIELSNKTVKEIWDICSEITVWKNLEHLFINHKSSWTCKEILKYQGDGVLYEAIILLRRLLAKYKLYIKRQK